jgi:pimeloyl-ACP methyl ester carboxylesterase
LEAKIVPFAPSEGASIWWDSEGAGPPVLLINGLGSPAETWRRLADPLREDFRVLTFDNRGVGRTGVPDGDYTVETMARDALAVLDAAGCSRAHVVGLSMGGLIAQELTLSFPDRVAGVVLVSTHLGIPHAGSSPDEMDLEAVTALTAAATLPSSERMASLVPFIYAPDTTAEVIAADLAWREAVPTTEEGFARQLTGVAAWERRSELADWGAPTLVVHGRLDRLVPLVHGQRLAEEIPGAQLAVVDGASHQVFTDQQADACGRVRDFLAHVDAAAVAL